MKLLVFSWTGKSNLGDESYKISFPRLFPGHELTFTDSLTKESVGAHDGIVLGGGNILNRYYLGKLRPYAGRVPMVAFSVGQTDDIDFGDLSMFSQIYVRDFLAAGRLRSAGVECVYCPDAAFCLEPDVVRGRSLLAGLLAGSSVRPLGRSVGVVVNGHLAGHDQDGLARDMFRFQAFSYDLANVLDRLDANCVFLSMMTRAPWDDRVAGGWVASRCGRWNKNVVVHDRLGVQETLDVVAALDAVVSTRLHSSIFATLAGVPFVDVWHHDKNLSYLETVGRSGWAVPFWDFSRERTHGLLSGMLGGAERRGLGEVAAEKRALLMGAVDGIYFNQ